MTVAVRIRSGTDMDILLDEELIGTLPPIAELWMHEPQWWEQLVYLMGLWLGSPAAEAVTFSAFWTESK